MIEKVSTRQGAIAVVKAVVIWFLCVLAGCGGCYFLSGKLFNQADRLAKQAANSVHPGQTIKEVLSVNSGFMSAAFDSTVAFISFGNPGKNMDGGGNECGELRLFLRSSHQRVSYSKNGGVSAADEDLIAAPGQDWGAEFADKHVAELARCTRITISLIKGPLRHCPAFVDYDKQLKVVRSGTKPCWD